MNVELANQADVGAELLGVYDRDSRAYLHWQMAEAEVALDADSLGATTDGQGGKVRLRAVALPGHSVAGRIAREAVIAWADGRSDRIVWTRRLDTPIRSAEGIVTDAPLAIITRDAGGAEHVAALPVTSP